MFRSLLPASGRPSPALVRILAILAVALLVAACASSGALTSAPERAVPPADVAPGASGGPVKDTTGASTGGGVAQADGTTALQDEQLIVRTGSLALEVKDIDAVLLQARARIVGLGGYVSDSERTSSGDYPTALITYRIPAARWDEALDALKGLSSKVVTEQTKAVEVTGQVLDLGARIDNLKATERALQAIMAQATKINAILDVQNQLTNVQGQIEQLSTQKAHLADQASLGTLAVTYTLPVVAVAQAASGWNLGAEFDRALAELILVGQGLAVAGVWLAVVGLPIGLGLALVVLLVLFVARRLVPRRPVTTGGPGLPTAAA